LRIYCLDLDRRAFFRYTRRVITFREIQKAEKIVYQTLHPTPQIRWPLLCERTGADVWVKHENHQCTGSFKVRGGVVYLDHILKQPGCPKKFVTATRGNHGQSLAFAARAHQAELVVVVPLNNSVEKNAAMRALGAKVLEHGNDFDEARQKAQHLAEADQMHLISPFHPFLIKGVGTGALEFLSAHRDLDTVYVPVGLGSGICSMILVRDGLGLKTKIVGVVTRGAPAYALSFSRKYVVTTSTAITLADGVACRMPDSVALEMMLNGVDRFLTISDEEVVEGIKAYFTDIHNLAEGAGALALAGLLREKSFMMGKKVGLMLTGGNIDLALFQKVIGGKVREP
jgi:threonine dehydratase